MKKFMYLGAAALAGLFATSCASDEPAAGTTDGMTTFTVQMPEDLTRAFADGTSAQQLFVAIYDAEAADGAAPLFTNFTGVKTNEGMSVTKAGEKKWTVSVNLVKNKSYDLVFWAQNPTATNAAPYTFDAEARTITVAYANMANYAEARDAFYKHVTYKSTTPDQQNITLTRAFAQINIGTTEADLKAYVAAGGVNNFAMAISGASTELNLFTDAVSKPTADAIKTTPVTPATLTTDTNPREQLSVTYNNETAEYDYLAMAYVLVGADGTNRDNLTVSLYNQEIAEGVQAFATYPNVPAQMNYRTNIFGDLLTNPETFNVVIDNEFNKDDINYFVPVSTEADFTAAIAAGKCPVLQNDLRINAIGDPRTGVENATVDLNNHKLSVFNPSTVNGNVTIKNGELNVRQDRTNYGGTACPILSLGNGGNINLENVKVTNPDNMVSCVAVMEPKGDWKNNGSITIKNCDLTSNGITVSTNATNASSLADIELPYTITIKDSKINGETGVYLNVPCNLVMDGCEVTANIQAMVIRGGKSTLNDCKFTTNCVVPDYDYNAYDWKSGTWVPVAAMTVGNNGAYNFAISVNATNCTFTVNNTTNLLIGQNRDQEVPCVYAMKGLDKAVDVNLTGCTFNGKVKVFNVNDSANVKF